MSRKTETGTLLPMTVTEGVIVNVMPHGEHEFLMTNKEVAIGYDTSEYVIRQCKSTNPDEFIEGKHFVKGVSISHTQPHQVFWTKRGVIRLGFFVKSKQAKLFRDWAEDLIIVVDELARQGVIPVPTKALPKKRNHNRLTSERLIRLLQLTHRIDNANLRNEIVEQLMGGNA